MPRPLTPVQVLEILAKRMEDQAASYTRVNMPTGYNVAIAELKRYFSMVRKAAEYLREQGFG